MISSNNSGVIGRFEAGVRRINSLFALVSGSLVLVIVAVVLVAIVTRVLSIPLVWANDVAQISFVYLVFLSFAPALASGHHVTVELFEPLVPRIVRRHLDVVASLGCIVFGAVFFYQLWIVTDRSFSDGRLAVMAIPVELKWVQLAGPVGMAQFLLTAAVQLASALRTSLSGTAEVHE